MNAHHQALAVKWPLASGRMSGVNTLSENACTKMMVYLGWQLAITAGDGAGQAQIVQGYDGTTKAVTPVGVFAPGTSDTTVYELMPRPKFGTPYESTYGAPKLEDWTGKSFINFGLCAEKGRVKFYQVTYSIDDAVVSTMTAENTLAPYASAAAGAMVAELQLANDAAGSGGEYVGWSISLVSGPGSGQTRRIAAYDGTTKTVTPDTAFDPASAATSLYTVHKRADGHYDGWRIEITGGAGAGQTRTVSDFDGVSRSVTPDSSFSPATTGTSEFKLHIPKWSCRPTTPTPSGSCPTGSQVGDSDSCLTYMPDQAKLGQLGAASHLTGIMGAALTLDSNAADGDGAYNGWRIAITGGAGSG